MICGDGDGGGGDGEVITMWLILLPTVCHRFSEAS